MDESKEIARECVVMLEKIHTAINHLNCGVKENNNQVINQCNTIDTLIDYFKIIMSKPNIKY